MTAIKSPFDGPAVSAQVLVTRYSKSLWGSGLVFLTIYLGVELLGHVVMCSAFSRILRHYFSKQASHLTVPPAVSERFRFPCLTRVCCVFFSESPWGWGLWALHRGFDSCPPNDRRCWASFSCTTQLFMSIFGNRSTTDFNDSTWSVCLSHQQRKRWADFVDPSKN